MKKLILLLILYSSFVSGYTFTHGNYTIDDEITCETNWSNGEICYYEELTSKMIKYNIPLNISSIISSSSTDIDCEVIESSNLLSFINTSVHTNTTSYGYYCISLYGDYEYNQTCIYGNCSYEYSSSTTTITTTTSTSSTSYGESNLLSEINNLNQGSGYGVQNNTVGTIEQEVSVMEYVNFLLSFLVIMFLLFCIYVMGNMSF